MPKPTANKAKRSCFEHDNAGHGGQETGEHGEQDTAGFEQNTARASRPAQGAAAAACIGCAAPPKRARFQVATWLPLARTLAL